MEGRCIGILYMDAFRFLLVAIPEEYLFTESTHNIPDLS